MFEGDSDFPVKVIKRAPEKGFFFKEIDCLGIRIKASQKAQDKALYEALRKLQLMLANTPVIANNLSVSGAEMHILAHTEMPTELPDHRHKKGVLYEGSLTFDERCRGWGDLRSNCGEENILKLPSDTLWPDSDICIHEFAHAVLGFGLDDAIRKRIKRQYVESLAVGRWNSTYAAKNHAEFFAELAVWYFGGSGDRGTLLPRPDAGRTWLQYYDPPAFSLLDDIFQGKLIPRKKLLQELAPISAMDESKIISQFRRINTTTIFENNTEHAVKLFWLNLVGNRKYCIDIEAMDRYTARGLIGCAYIVTDLEGRGLAIFQIDAVANRAIIDSSFLPVRIAPRCRIARRYKSSESPHEISSHKIMPYS